MVSATINRTGYGLPDRPRNPSPSVSPHGFMPGFTLVYRMSGIWYIRLKIHDKSGGFNAVICRKYPYRRGDEAVIS